MDYKWSKVDLNYTSRKENIINNKENIKNDLKNGDKMYEICKRYKISNVTINKIKKDI
jgi:Mor family transcriptional regulator